MSRAARRRAGRREKESSFDKTPIWIMSGSVLAALLVVALVAGPRGGEGHHPVPRADAHTMHVMPAARYASTPSVAEVYDLAAQIPAVLDGMFCYCQCLTNFGHYSLLDCFLGDHGAACDICQREAVLAFEMTSRGESLEAIRAEVDQRYRT